ncbi:DNA topoisomerase IV subunit A [Mesoplasma entomophilum]|uniref:DNA topoisomerase 4 subunit A n=1 Tax=Mesoplasma entomophilum TaxID=2149 RepID=A0A3S5Y037_9MOLU|nr:DNA topoisomerase IV subunit A [Mesoplasma entomophilum]ATQ35470.1 DNA topoisomerase IV subunit A [Mesoplasma entomophilum]ATZ19431.1 DNA topoisomerase IV subunit A [Mesoplasma entomophilum]
MAKKIDNSNIESEKGIISYALEDLMGERFGRYAKYIIQERALPDARDGLKPVQRRILYAMNELNLTYDKPYKKSARVVGEVIGKYHPHGDTSIYDAMVRMSQWWKLGMPLIDMQGNNGSIDGDSAAAMRYTETRLAKISDLMLDDLNKNTVKFAPNFDDSEKEPTVLPSYFPNILVNGSTGIAAGYATNMPPHNLGEIIDATIKLIRTPNTRIDTILEIVKGPDFPTGGTVQGRNGIKDAFTTGKGKVIVNSKWHEEDNNIIIDEIPYEVVKQDLVKKIGDVIDANPGLGILEVRDETDRNGLRIAIDLSDKANLDTVRKFLFKSTPLSISYNYNNVAIVDLQPKQLGIIELIHAYIAHYKEVFTFRTQFDLNKAEKRLEIILGLIKAMSILDQVISVIRSSTNRSDAIENLVSKFIFSQPQAAAIVDMRLYRLTSTDVVKLQNEKEELDVNIAKLKAILNSEEVMDNEIINRLREVKKQFQTPRRSTVEDSIENLDVEQKEVLVEHEYNLWISKDGYLKAIESKLISKNDPAVFGRKPNDMWIAAGEVSNLQHLILITNKGTYYSIPLYKLPMSKWRDMGVHVNTIATMDPSEHIVSAFVVKDFAEALQQILITSKNGNIKRIPVKDLETKIFTRAFRIMKLDAADEIVSASLITSKTRTCGIITRNGYGVRYHIEDIPVQGTNSKGVKAANLKEDYIVAGLGLTSEDTIMYLTEKDGVKKFRNEDLPIYIRPKRGVRVLPERKRGTEYITFVFNFNANEENIIKTIDTQDMYQEVNVNKYRHIELTSVTGDFDIKDVAFASLSEINKVKPNDMPPGALNADDDAEGYVSKEEIRARQEANKGKVSAKVVVSKNVKEESEKRIQSLTGGLSDLLGDISSVLGTPSKPKPKKEVKDEFQLDLSELLEE